MAELSRSRGRGRLDTPRETRRQLVRRPAVDADRFGVFAEQFARFMGTATFLLYMTVFVAAWMLWNALAPRDLRFDDFRTANDEALGKPGVLRLGDVGHRRKVSRAAIVDPMP